MSFTGICKSVGGYTFWISVPGDVLLSINAHVAVLSNGRLEDYCSNCFAPGDSLQRCTGCKAIFYCDSVGSRFSPGYMFWT
jgi:SET and MYND domain-containing protein